jgi:hypothetical protein
MTTYDNIRTDTWSLSLPSDWLEKGETDGGALHFESPGGDKAIYIATWNIGDKAPTTASDAAASFTDIERSSLREMNGYSWHALVDQTHEYEGAAVSFVDSLAKDRCYRIASKIIARPPLVIRASFHDYSCEDYEQSRAYFLPVIESLRFYNPES